MTGIFREEDWKIQVAGAAHAVSATALVDASGDAVVAGLLGVDSAMAEAPRLQRPAYVFGVHNAVAMDDDTRLQTAGLIVEGIRAGDLPERTRWGFPFAARDGREKFSARSIWPVAKRWRTMIRWIPCA